MEYQALLSFSRHSCSCCQACRSSQRDSDVLYTFGIDGATDQSPAHPKEVSSTRRQHRLLVAQGFLQSHAEHRVAEDSKPSSMLKYLLLSIL